MPVARFGEGRRRAAASRFDDGDVVTGRLEVVGIERQHDVGAGCRGLPGDQHIVGASAARAYRRQPRQLRWSFTFRGCGSISMIPSRQRTSSGVPGSMAASRRVQALNELLPSCSGRVVRS